MTKEAAIEHLQKAGSLFDEAAKLPFTSRSNHNQLIESKIEQAVHELGEETPKEVAEAIARKKAGQDPKMTIRTMFDRLVNAVKE